MSIPHPIPYQGSKRSLAKTIIQYFPDNIERLIEPFAGSSAVSIAASYYSKAKHFFINDINEPLINLWSDIINDPYGISKKYERIWNAQHGDEKEYYFKIRDKFNETHRTDYFLFLLTRCVKASVRYNSSGHFNQSPDNRRNGTNPQTIKMNILGASHLLKNKSTLSCIDYTKILEAARPNDLIYMDPPYQGVCANRDQRYINGFKHNDFIDYLQSLNNNNIFYIVSYDGRTGTKQHGEYLPSSLSLKHIEINAGRSTQATLLGRIDNTFESLYISPALLDKLECKTHKPFKQKQQHISFEAAI